MQLSLLILITGVCVLVYRANDNLEAGGEKKRWWRMIRPAQLQIHNVDNHHSYHDNYLHGRWGDCFLLGDIQFYPRTDAPIAMAADITIIPA